MIDTQTSFTLKPETRQRNALIMGWVISVLGAFLLLYGVLSFIFVNPDKGRLVYIPFYIMLLLVGILDIWLSRRGHSDAGSLSVVLLWLVVVVAIGMILMGQGLIFLLLSIFIVAVISILALSPRYQPYTIGASVLVGLFVLFFDLYVVADWRRQALTSSLTVIFGGVIIAFFLVFLAFQLRNFSLRVKVVLSFLVVCLGAVSVVSGLTNIVTRSQLTDAADNTLLVGAVQTATLLDTFIQNNLDVLRVEAQDTDIVDLLELPPDERAGSVVAEKVTVILENYRTRDEDISSYALFDLQGVDILDTEPSGIGSPQAEQLYFQEPMLTGKPYVSPVLFSSASEARLYFSALVLSESGETLGVLCMRYDAAILQEIISGASGLAGEQSFAVLLDENGIRLAHGLSSENIFKAVAPLDASVIATLQAQGRLPDVPAEQLATDLPEFAAGLNGAGQEAFFTTPLPSLNNKPASGAVHRLKNQNWFLVFFQPEDIHLSTILAQTRMITLLGVLVAFVVAISAAGVAQWLSRPIAQLTLVASRVAAGDLTAQAQVQSNDEVGTLARVFNHMTMQLAETIGTLEERVAERTRALETSTEVSRRLSTILDPQKLVHEVVEQLKAAFGYYHVHIYLFDDARQNLIMVGGTGEAGQIMLARGHKIPRGRGLVGRAAETNQVVLVADVSQAPNWLANPLLPDTKAEIAVPIAIGPEVLGVLDVQQNVVGSLDDQDAALIQAIASQVAIAVQNAHAYERAQHQAQRDARIAAIGQRIQAATSIDEVLKIAVSELGQSVGVQRASIDLRPSDLKVGDDI